MSLKISSNPLLSSLRQERTRIWTDQKVFRLLVSTIPFPKMQEKTFCWCKTYIHKTFLLKPVSPWRMQSNGTEEGRMTQVIWGHSHSQSWKIDIYNLTDDHNYSILSQNASVPHQMQQWITNGKPYPKLIFCLFLYCHRRQKARFKLHSGCWKMFCFAEKVV